MHSIIELPKFINEAEKLFSENEKNALIDFLAFNPLAGDVIAGTGGVRKLRWGRDGMGKRGGSRVIYLFGGNEIPLVMITVYAKNDKENLTKEERNKMAVLSKIIIEQLKR